MCVWVLATLLLVAVVFVVWFVIWFRFADCGLLHWLVVVYVWLRVLVFCFLYLPLFVCG